MQFSQNFLNNSIFTACMLNLDPVRPHSGAQGSAAARPEGGCLLRIAAMEG